MIAAPRPSRRRWRALAEPVRDAPAPLATSIPAPGSTVREIGWGYVSTEHNDPAQLPTKLQQLDTRVADPKNPECHAVDGTGDTSWGIRDGDSARRSRTTPREPAVATPAARC